MLQCKGNSDNSNSKQNTKTKVGKRYPKTTNKKPNNIHYRRQAAGITRTGTYFATKRPQRKYGQFQRLKSEWNSNNGNHHSHAGDDIFKSYQRSTKNQPDDIAYRFHIL